MSPHGGALALRWGLHVPSQGQEQLPPAWPTEHLGFLLVLPLQANIPSWGEKGTADARKNGPSPKILPEKRAIKARVQVL